MSLLTSLNAIMNMPCGTQTQQQQQQQQQQPEEQQPQQQRPRQPQAAPPAASASAIATANSASSTNSSNASEHSSYHHRTGQTNNGSFEGGEHNSSSGYGSSAEAQVGSCVLYEMHSWRIRCYPNQELTCEVSFCLVPIVSGCPVKYLACKVNFYCTKSLTLQAGSAVHRNNILRCDQGLY